MTREPWESDALNAWLDGRLSPAERAEWEKRLESDAALREALARQQDLDERMKRLFVPPPADRAAGILERAMSQATADRGARAGFSLNGEGAVPLSVPLGAANVKPRRMRPLNRALFALGTAAAIAFLIGAGWWGFAQWRHTQRYTPAGLERFDWTYRDRVARGFDPNMVCENDLQFATAFWQVTGEGLLLKNTDTIRILGFTTNLCFKANSRTLLTLVGGQPVMVFFTAAKFDTRQKESDSTLPGGLHLFHKRIGSTSLYELTPLPNATLLDKFFDPQFPVESYQSTRW